MERINREGGGLEVKRGWAGVGLGFGMNRSQPNRQMGEINPFRSLRDQPWQNYENSFKTAR